MIFTGGSEGNDKSFPVVKQNDLRKNKEWM
jgi:hypothetical protein